MLCECENPHPGVNRDGDFFVSSIRFFRHESDLVPMLWHPFALMQAPPRRDDEPTIGLHPQDVKKLILIFDHLIQLGATVIVIEHDLELVTNCDYIIDMGPWGGTEGGRVVVEGTPEAVAANPESITGRYLKQVLAEDR